MTNHQQKQLEVIQGIEEDIRNNTITFSTVAPVEDYENDPRIALTSVHFPSNNLATYVENILKPLKLLSPEQYYYPAQALHMTIKNVKVIHDPPNFTQSDIQKAKLAFDHVIPYHKKFQVYFYRLLLFPMNLSLIGTTDPELDSIIFDLTKKLQEFGVPDDKKFNNSKYFFSNMTLARFTSPISDAFKKKVYELSQQLVIGPYTVNAISVIVCNAVVKRLQTIGTWDLR